MPPTIEPEKVEIFDSTLRDGSKTLLTISRNSGGHAIAARAREIGLPIEECAERAFAAAVIDFSQTRTIVTANDLIAIATHSLGGSRETVAV